MAGARGVIWSFVVSGGILSALVPQSSDAQTLSDAETLAALRDCGALERDRARLACFDGVLTSEDIVATSAAEPSVGSAVPVSEPQRSAQRDSSSGRGERPESSPSVEPRTVTIVSLNDDRPGAARFVAADGTIFVQTSGGTPRGGYPEVPFDASLEQGAFGSLFLGVAERRRVRVTRAE